MRYRNASERGQPVYEQAALNGLVLRTIAPQEEIEMDDVYVYVPPLLFAQVHGAGFVVVKILAAVETYFTPASGSIVITTSPPQTVGTPLPPEPEAVPLPPPLVVRRRRLVTAAVMEIFDTIDGARVTGKRGRYSYVATLEEVNGWGRLAEGWFRLGDTQEVSDA